MSSFPPFQNEYKQNKYLEWFDSLDIVVNKQLTLPTGIPTI